MALIPLDGARCRRLPHQSRYFRTMRRRGVAASIKITIARSRLRDNQQRGPVAKWPMIYPIGGQKSSGERLDRVATVRKDVGGVGELRGKQPGVEVAMDREERRWLRHGIRLVLLGVLLIAFFAVASFALGPGELPESRLGLAVGVTLCPMGLLLWWLSRPTPVFWPIVLRVFACAVLAVTSFWLWWWAESPLGAFGVGALATPYRRCCRSGCLTIAFVRLRGESNKAGVPGGQSSLGLHVGPNGETSRGGQRGPCRSQLGRAPTPAAERRSRSSTPIMQSGEVRNRHSRGRTAAAPWSATPALSRSRQAADDKKEKNKHFQGSAKEDAEHRCR